MTRVMIVEDEYLVRVGLRTCIDWAAHGLELLEDAADGEEAFRLIAENRPDILLLDLNLPKLDGFGLMDKLAGAEIRLGIIVLSCCDDFDSVRAALQRGVLDYVNKLTMNPAELLAVFEKALRGPRAHYPEGLLAGGPAPDRSALLAGLVCGAVGEETAAKEAFSAGRCACLLCTASPGQLLPSQAVRLNMCRQILKNGGYDAAACTDSEGSLCIALPPEAEPGQVARLLKQQLEPAMGLACLIGFGPPFEGAEGLVASYEKACGVREELFWGRHGSVIDFAALPPEESRAEAAFSACEEALARELLAMNPEGCQKALEELFTHFSTPPAMPRTAFLQRLLRLLQRAGRENQPNGSSAQDWQMELAGAQTARQAREIARRAVDGFFVGAGAPGRYSPIVQKSVAYILQNRSRTVRLDETAQAVNVSESYLSQLFKKETGMNFVAFVQRYKINLAKKMLEERMRVYEVCDAIGFDNPNYFAKVFRRLTGCTPAEYRKSGRGPGEGGEEGGPKPKERAESEE